MALAPVGAFDASAPWRLAEAVSLRDEDFGALAYHHVTRRLVFLKSAELVAIVRSLSDHESADAAVSHAVDEAERPRYRAALASLARSGVIDGR